MPEPSKAEIPFPPLAMYARNPHAGNSAGTLPWWRRISAREPELWMAVSALAAWLFLIWSHANTGDGGTRGPGEEAAALVAMVIAMMLPLTFGRVRELARPEARSRHRTAIAFVCGYLGVWVPAMFGIDAAWRQALSVGGWAWSAGAVIAAAVLWEVAPAKWRQSRRCDEAVALRGGQTTPADAGPVWVGAMSGTSCVASCWTLMAACVAFAHDLRVMALFFAIQLHGRYGRPAPPALMALAVLGVCLGSLALRMAGHHHHPGI